MQLAHPIVGNIWLKIFDSPLLMSQRNHSLLLRQTEKQRSLAGTLTSTATDTKPEGNNKTRLDAFYGPQWILWQWNESHFICKCFPSHVLCSQGFFVSFIANIVYIQAVFSLRPLTTGSVLCTVFQAGERPKRSPWLKGSFISNNHSHSSILK